MATLEQNAEKLEFSKPVSHTSHGVMVRVRTAWLKDLSRPSDNVYAHSYIVEITNANDVVVQLMSRKWLITNALGEEQTVQGEGVIGEQPLLQPQKIFLYDSWMKTDTPYAKMSGQYHMKQKNTGKSFVVQIPEFTLLCRSVLH